MEHEQQSDPYTQSDHHYENDTDTTLDVSYEASYESQYAHEAPQDTQPQPQPQQTYPPNQREFQSRPPVPPPSRAPPSLPTQQMQSPYTNQGYPNRQARAYQPQPNPQYYPQAGYTPAHTVQAPPQNYQTQTNPQGYTKPHQRHSPYNPNAGAPGGSQNGGYGGAAQGVQMQGTPAPGYMGPQPQYRMSSYGNNTGTVGWTTGMFDCMEDPNNACGTSGILYGVIPALIGAACILSCTYRSKMRTQYDLLEVPAADWLTHCFCECCAHCQEYRELRNRGLDPALGWHGNMMRNQNMQPQVAMTPPVNQTMAGPKSKHGKIVVNQTMAGPNVAR